ncbi:MAG TPA: SPOR domain-containing protein [bacterium]|nr:SPOR domain-containing protein [bacterium]HQI48840.1 SPOR domain-containing protein [bacterium]HQJ66019.1 SPOR domain-containing protein [bacterium]
MKIRMYGLLTLFVVLCSAAAAQQRLPAQAVATTVAAPADSALQQEENWDPVELGAFLGDFTVGRGDAISGGELLSRIKNKAVIDSSRMVEGFRIQLLATRDESEARRARDDARSFFPENSYLLYDNPYYKLRLGDCLTRAAADSLQQRAISKGFSGAWIVRSQVHEFTPKLNIFYTTPPDSTALEWDRQQN